MASLIKTKRRISSVTSTRKITNAMDLVATAKLKRFKSNMYGTNNYVNDIKDVMIKLNSLIKKDDDIISNKSDSRLFIIINSNLGLCGSYNNDIFRFANDLIKKDDKVITIGLKGYTHYKLRDDIYLIENYINLNEKISSTEINKFARDIFNRFNNDRFYEVNLIYVDYINTITFKPKKIKLLPLTLDSEETKLDLLPPIIEPDPETLFNELIPIYLSSTIYNAIVTSQVSEQASRRNAMENATDNADDLLNKLKLEYNKARQSAITQEISEVVSGANNVN